MALVFELNVKGELVTGWLYWFNSWIVVVYELKLNDGEVLDMTAAEPLHVI